MKSNGLWTALGITVFGVALGTAGAFILDTPRNAGNTTLGGPLFLVGWCLIIFGAFRVIRWLYLNLSGVARTAGDMAAKGANHVDTFKEAFKDGRNK